MDPYRQRESASDQKSLAARALRGTMRKVGALAGGRAAAVAAHSAELHYAYTTALAGSGYSRARRPTDFLTQRTTGSGSWRPAAHGHWPPDY